METLADFNDAKRAKYWKAVLPAPNGIECPVCQEELWDSYPRQEGRLMLTNAPPSQNVHCPDCGYAGYRLA